MEAFTRVFCIGETEVGDLWITVKYSGDSGSRGGRLSITGVEGPKCNGDAKGSCGQCLDALRNCNPWLTPPHGKEPIVDPVKLAAVWERWHLNDMRAGTPLQ